MAKGFATTRSDPSSPMLPVLDITGMHALYEDLMKCAHNETARAPLDFMVRCCNLAAHSISLYHEYEVFDPAKAKAIPVRQIIDLHKVIRAISCSLPEGVRPISSSP